MTPAALLARLRRHLFALTGVVLLAAACLQATGPLGAPLERGRGSAFSAGTVDVAVIQTRGEAATVPALAPLPADPRNVTHIALARADGPAPAPHWRPRATGPPPYPHLPPAAGPRAPPA